MLLIREIMYCKPGKVKPMVEKFLAMSKIGNGSGNGDFRVLTDFSGERYWTIVAEMVTPDLKTFEEMMQGRHSTPEQKEEMESLMKGYHDLIDFGRREIYKIEG